MARKNGKTALIAALVLVHLVGPESEINGEIYSVATEREQAGQVYKMAAQMVRLDPDLESRLRCIDSTKTITCYSNGSFYRAVSSESGSKHGLNPSVVIYDELAQAKNRELYDVMDTSMGAREEPLFIVISTQSNDPQHILSELIDDGLNAADETTVCHLYEVPIEVDDIFDEECWHLANPALDDFRSLSDLRALAARAARMPSFEASFRNLYLNQRVNRVTPLIPRQQWLNCQHKVEPPRSLLVDGEDIYLAIDLSSSLDLTALVGLAAKPKDDRTHAWFWKPEAWLEEHEKRDRAKYSLWVDQGYLIAAPGRTISYDFVANTVGEAMARYNVLGLAFDRWRIETLRNEFDRIGLECWIDGKDNDTGGLKLIPWGQGYRDMSPAIDAFEEAVVEETMKHPGNPVMGMCVSNAMVISDPSGNRKLNKSATRFRIDGAVAKAMAFGLKKRDQPEEDQTVSYKRGDMFG